MSSWGTIRRRLILWYVFFLAITVIGFSIYLQHELQISLITQVDAGLQVAASQLLVDVDDSVSPPTLRPMSTTAVDQLMQSRSALRLVRADGTEIAEVGVFPELPTNIPPDVAGFETINLGGIPWRIYTQQVDIQNQQFDIWLQSAQSLNTVDDARDSLLNLIIIALPITLVAAAVSGTFIANRALSPVDAMTRTAEAINATDMSRRIAYDGPPDEVGRLSQTLNSMLDRLQTAFEAERRFTADASHELRTPLTAIKGHIGVTLTRKREPEEYEATLHHIQHETDRLIRLANDLLFLARLDVAVVPRQIESINLSDLLEAVIDQMHILGEAKAIHFHTTIPSHLPIQGMADHLIRLFLNILDNALKYTPIGGTVTITAAAASDTEVSIKIGDTGPGIAAEHLTHLFERFYRVEQDRAYSGGGSGLGLAIALEITREHAGTITVDSVVNQGTEVTVRLPLDTSPKK